MINKAVVVGTVVVCLAAGGAAFAQLAFTKAQVGDRIRKVEDGVDEFRKWSENRVEQGETKAQAGQAAGRIVEAICDLCESAT